MINNLNLNLMKYAREKTLCSPITVDLEQKDVDLMYKTSIEVFSLLNSSSYNDFFQKNNLLKGSDVSHDLNFDKPLCAIGIDFHITPEGPKLIEINSNAGGLVTSALWAHRDKPEEAEKTLALFVNSFSTEFQQKMNKKALNMAIVDEDPYAQFTIYDLLLTQELMRFYDIACDIVDSNSVVGTYDIIYNRTCDFLLNSEKSVHLNRAHDKNHNIVVPNPYMFTRVSDKRSLVTIYNFIRENSEIFPAMNKTLLECMHIKDFVDSGLKRSGWFFKPGMAYGGTGVYRGRKISMIKFQEIIQQEFIAQRAATPPTTTHLSEDFKYDVRVFVWRDTIIDLSIRAYQGRITNFRTLNGGYTSYCIK
ncbi:MAG: hypothetical protein Q9M18_07910 [Mariprofundaceae bacterium]|nr:hypothetical protein [Mariprofundaceae bacterium]